ncbi:MAG: ABC transporter ATP-binding protein [Phycisphaerae bacterium]
MNPKLISADMKKGKDASKTLRIRDLARVLALAAPYKHKLALGLLLTVVFAGFHTLSIAGAFPVFKILLEEEGITGWADRTIAGACLGVTFAPLTSGDELRVVQASGTASAPSALQAGDILLGCKIGDDAEIRGGRAAVEAVAAQDSQHPLFVSVSRGGVIRIFSVARRDPPTKLRVLRQALSLIPTDPNDKDGKLWTLGYILMALVSVVFVGNVFRYFGEILIAQAVLRSMMDLRARLYERVLQLPMSFFAGQSTADMVTRFVQDIQEIQRGLMTFFGKFIREPLKALLVLGFAFTLDWRITLTMIFAVPITGFIFLTVGRKVKKANRRLLQGYGYMIDALTSSLHNLPVVKVYTAEEYERQRLTQVDRHMFTQQLRLARLQAFVSPMIETLAVVAGSMGTVWLASRVVHHALPISTFVTLGVALAMLFDPLRKLTDVYVRVQRSTAGAERILQVIDYPIEQDSAGARTEIQPLSAAITFEHVSFTYPNAERPALNDINLVITKGETIALVGPNGCGKTTLVSMIPRLRVPDAGTIRFDNTPLSQADLLSLRRQISVVSQEAVVFGGTPADNISYGASAEPGRPHERERIVQAARRAHADDFINNIPGGYDADLGERGTTLSGGQRQRLAIARAIYRDAPVLIFDEATSQIDSESEQKIQEALKEFAQDRTTIIIAHRLSTIQFATRIVVMEAGTIIDSGTHKDLLARCPLYRKLCETQFGGD